MYSSDVLNTSHPVGLQNKVFVDLMIHLCNRGRENLREMTRVDFQIMSDSAGNRYVCIKDKQTKNHRGDGNAETSQNGRMYETPGLPRCPVTSFEKYISKLNGDCLAFWQKPKRPFKENDVCWYEKMAVGKNTLYDKMKSISTAAGLSNKFTNHYLRATCITALDQSGFEARHIMSVSGQKCESSIRAYSRNVAENVRRNMSLSQDFDKDLPSSQLLSQLLGLLPDTQLQELGNDEIGRQLIPEQQHRDIVLPAKPIVVNFYNCEVHNVNCK